MCPYIYIHTLPRILATQQAWSRSDFIVGADNIGPAKIVAVAAVNSLKQCVTSVPRECERASIYSLNKIPRSVRGLMKGLAELFRRKLLGYYCQGPQIITGTFDSVVLSKQGNFNYRVHLPHRPGTYTFTCFRILVEYLK